MTSLQITDSDIPRLDDMVAIITGTHPHNLLNRGLDGNQ
jgi:hypothetical protein